MKAHVKQRRVGTAAFGRVQERSVRRWQRAVAPPSLEVLGSRLDRALSPDFGTLLGQGVDLQNSSTVYDSVARHFTFFPWFYLCC